MSNHYNLIYNKYPAADGSVSYLDKKVDYDRNQIVYYYEGKLLPNQEIVLFQVTTFFDRFFSRPYNLGKESINPIKSDIINVFKKTTSYPIISDALDEVYFCLAKKTLSSDELPEEAFVFRKKNPHYSKVVEVVIAHNNQFPWCKQIDLDSNPTNQIINLAIDELLPRNIKNFNHDARMFLFLRENQTLLQAGRELLNQGAHYCDFMAQTMKEEGVFDYFTSGHFKDTI